MYRGLLGVAVAQEVGQVVYLYIYTHRHTGIKFCSAFFLRPGASKQQKQDSNDEYG